MFINTVGPPCRLGQGNGDKDYEALGSVVQLVNSVYNYLAYKSFEVSYISGFLYHL